MQSASTRGIFFGQNHIIIASGSRSWIPPIAGADLPGVVTTREILQLEKVPERLIIVGAGIIGQEFAAIFSALGSTVTVLEALDRILPGVDGELARKYLTLLRGRSVSCETGVRIAAILKTNDRLRVVYEKKSKEKTADADLILMATGRRPFMAGLGIEGAGIRVENGAIEGRSMVEDVRGRDLCGGRRDRRPDVGPRLLHITARSQQRILLAVKSPGTTPWFPRASSPFRRLHGWV